MTKSAFSIYQHARRLVFSISEMVQNKEAERWLVQPIDQNHCVLWQIEVVEFPMRVLVVFNDQCAVCAIASLNS
jgi:hypothetical protein